MIDHCLIVHLVFLLKDYEWGPKAMRKQHGVFIPEPMPSRASTDDPAFEVDGRVGESTLSIESGIIVR